MTLRIDTSRPDQLKVRFTWTGPQPVGSLSVVGSFNNWTAGLDELTPDADGNRSVTIGLPYERAFTFRYLGAEGQWFDEPDADEITSQGSVIRAIARPEHAPG